MSFDKLFKIKTQDTKTAISQAVKNDFDFICYLSDMKIRREDTLTYPNVEEVDRWMSNLFTKELKPKVYNEKALEAMKKRGITPFIQKEILTIVIAGSETFIHVGIFIPKNYLKLSDFDITEFMLLMSNDNDCGYDEDFIPKGFLFRYKTDSPLKEIDNAKKRIFDFLKSKEIYIEENDEEEIYNFE